MINLITSEFGMYIKKGVLTSKLLYIANSFYSDGIDKRREYASML